jgi:hypothetical protein
VFGSESDLYLSILDVDDRVRVRAPDEDGGIFPILGNRHPGGDLRQELVTIVFKGPECRQWFLHRAVLRNGGSATLSVTDSSQRAER